MHGCVHKARTQYYKRGFSCLVHMFMYMPMHTAYSHRPSAHDYTTWCMHTHHTRYTHACTQTICVHAYFFRTSKTSDVIKTLRFSRTCMHIFIPDTKWTCRFRRGAGSGGPARLHAHGNCQGTSRKIASNSSRL